MFIKFGVLSLALLMSCSLWAKNIRVMSYNVENLFDTEHDAGKDDWTFIPNSNPDKAYECSKVEIEYYRKTCYDTDWTPDKLEIKLNQITKVVKSSGAKLPDILVLLEVENEKVVEMLRKKTGFEKFIITNGPDERGVDVAVLYNSNADLKFVSSKEHQLKTSATGIKSPTRNILEANFKIQNKNFSLYVNHWPSQQSGPTSRESAAKQLLSIIKAKMKDPNAKIMLVGDFNVTDSDKPNPIEDVLTKQTGLVDVYTKLTQAEKNKLAPGTYFYGWDFSWNRLDRIIVNEGFLKGLPTAVAGSFDIYAPQFITRIYEQVKPDRPGYGQKQVVPWGYWHSAYTASRAGFSDHFPVQILIDL